MLGQIERITGHRIDDSLMSRIDEVRSFRNHIVHMCAQHEPDRHRPMLDAKESARFAAMAADAASPYLDFVASEFARIGLQLRGVHERGEQDV